MKLEATVLKHEVREYVSQGQRRKLNRAHVFATPADGFADPITLDLPPDTPQLEVRGDYRFRLVGMRAFGGEVVFSGEVEV